MSDEEFDNYNEYEDFDGGGFGGEEEDLEAEGDGGYGSGMDEDDEYTRPDYDYDGATFHAEMDAFCPDSTGDDGRPMVGEDDRLSKNL